MSWSVKNMASLINRLIFSSCVPNGTVNHWNWLPWLWFKVKICSKKNIPQLWNHLKFGIHQSCGSKINGTKSLSLHFSEVLTRFQKQTNLKSCGVNEPRSGNWQPVIRHNMFRFFRPPQNVSFKRRGIFFWKCNRCHEIWHQPKLHALL